MWVRVVVVQVMLVAMAVQKLMGCGCGCGTLIPTVSPYGRPRKYAPGHNNKGKSNWWLVKDRVKKRTSHERAVKAKRDVETCEWQHVGDCKGDLTVAHVDGDPFNNSQENLRKLCRSHHWLLDRGRIDPENPVMPEFYVDGSGKRRYKKVAY